MRHSLMMFCFSLVLALPAHSEDAAYALGIGISADNANGRALLALADYSFNENSAISLLVASTRSDGFPENVNTRAWSLGASHNFGALGIEASAGQSGDPDDFDAAEWSFGVFHKSARWRVSLRYDERDIDLVLRRLLVDSISEFTVPLQANGLRASARYRSESGVSVYANARRYDYDRDLTRLNGLEILRRLSPTTLTLSGSLIDSNFATGIEIPIGERAIDVSYARDKLAGGLGEIDSLSVGFLTPVNQRSDFDVSLGVSRGDANTGSTVFISLLYLFYGGL